MNTQSNLTVTGIDFGSSAVKIAAVLKGGVEIITNEANFRQTPNVVGFTQKQRLIGQAGQVKIKSNHSNTVIAPTRFLGFDNTCSYLNEQLKFCPAKPKKFQNEESTLKFNLLNGSQRQLFTPQQLVAAYLTQIQKIIAQTNNLANKNMVIAVPTYFTQHQRKALLDAIEIAKKKMNCDYSTQLVNEQIATSMDYGYSKRNEFSQDLQKSKKVLFVDFGHSKTSVFITSFNKQHMRIIANKFERQLGCKFMDEQLLKFYAQKFDQAHPNMQLNLLQSKKAVLKLLENVQKQRKVLSGNFEHDLSIECLLEDEDIFYSMKRDQYQKICAPIVQKFKKLLNDFAGEIQQKGIKYDCIQLIGGGTRIPAIINAIAQVFGQQPSRTINSNQCVARGAALISAMNSSIFRVQSYSFFTISPYTVDLKINEKSQKKLFQINELLLRQKSVQFQVDQNIQSFTLSVQYDEIQKGLKKKIFECQVELISNKQQKIQEKNTEMKEESEQNKKVKLSLIFTFDQCGLINLEKISSVNKSYSVKIGKVNVFPKFTTKELNQMEQKQKLMTINDLKMKKFYEKKNQFEATIYKIRDNLQNFLKVNSEFISEVQINAIKSLIEVEQNWLNSGLQSNSELKIQDFTKRVQLLNKKIEMTYSSINHLKQAHTQVNSQLQKLANFLNQIITKKQQSTYPEQVNKAGQWINEIFQKQKTSPKFELPVVSIEQIKQVHQQVAQKLTKFDQQIQRQRQMNYRKKQQQQRHPTQQSQYQKPTFSTFNPYGGYANRQAYDDNQYKPRTTRSNRSAYNNTGPFGSFFGNNGFSGFF